MLTWQLTTSDLNNNRIGFFRIYIYIFTFPMFVLSSSIVKRRNPDEPLQTVSWTPSRVVTGLVQSPSS